jgi:hypothetical protein
MGEEGQPDIAVFKATFPPIKSAILISGDGTGGSIKLEIPQIEREVFRLLMDMCQDVLIVTIQRANAETLTNFDDETKEEPKSKTTRMDLRRAAKRRD